MTLTREEMIDILEGIARDSGNAAARIAAIKQLNEMVPPPSPKSGFEELDGDDELAARRQTRAS
jgi:hypothetical protein